MGVISGIDMAVGGENTARLWKIRYLGDPPDYVASNTQGGVARKCGNTDWEGFYLGFGHTPAVFPGENFTFTGSVDGSVGATGTAICDEIGVTWNIEEGKIIEYLVRFSANGALTLGAAVAADAAQPNPPCTEDMYVAFDGSAKSHIRSMKLAIKARNKRYASSTTSGEYRRTAGPIDVEWEFSQYEDTPSVLPAPNSNAQLRFYVTASTYWQINWAKVFGIEEYGVDHESPYPVYAVVKGAFYPFDGTSAGSIITPAGVTKWP